MQSTVLARMAASLCLLFAMLVAGGSVVQAESTLDKIKARGKFLAGVRYDYPPIGVLDAEGKPSGMGVELAKLFADKMGVKVEYVQVVSKSRFALLKSGNIDAEFGPTTPSVDREQVADFSIPYVWDGVVLLVPKGSSAKLTDYAPPKKIALTQGSNIGDMIKEHVPNAEFIRFQEYTDAVSALLNGKVNAMGINRFAGVEMVKKNPSLDMSEDFFVDPWAITLPYNDSKWRSFVNVTLQELWLEGKYQELYKEYFGIAPNFKMWSEFRLQPGVGEKKK
jgi:polar amino acid transport system substrate-binding protein